MSGTAKSRDEAPGDDPRVLRAAQEYLAELEAGRRPRRGEFVARFPDLAADLGEYLDALDMVHGAAPLLHSSVGRPAVAEPPPAEPLGDFRILREIGRGGMGVVYEAVQLSLGRHVALKVLPFAAALDTKQLQRFQNEAQAAAHLHHTNIVPVYAVGSERGVHYYAMQLIDGHNLAELITQMRPEEAVASLGPVASGARDDLAVTGPMIADRPNPAAATVAAAALSTQRASRSGHFYRTAALLAAQAAEALEHAHQFGIIHRDVKPANLMVDARGNLWVTDFGLAQFHNRAGLTRTGDLLGTLRYMSPEQAAGQGAPLDPRTDIYSLGATLYELLTLEPLFGGGDHGRLLRQILYDEPRPLRAVDRAVPPELETIVLKAVSKNPSDRYATARELADDLHRFLDNKPIRARRPTLVQRARKWTQRHPSLAVAGVLLCVLGAAGLLVNNHMLKREQEKTLDRARQAEERFRLARRLVDDLTRLSDDDMLDRPDLQNIRKKLLETSLEYYGVLIDQQQLGDQDAPSDLKDTQARVAKILADLAVLQGAGRFFLLKDANVLDDLNLADGQREQIRAMTGAMDRQLDESFRDYPRLTPDERRQRFVALAGQNDKGMRKILTEKQLARLRQIDLQLQGLRAFDDADLVAALKLSPQQKEQIRSMEIEMFLYGPGSPFGGRSGPGGPGGRGPGGRGGPGGPQQRGGPPKESGPSSRFAAEKIREMLTAEQAARWKELTGEPFKGRMPPGSQPPPGHFRPER